MLELAFVAKGALAGLELGTHLVLGRGGRAPFTSAFLVRFAAFLGRSPSGVPAFDVLLFAVASLLAVFLLIVDVDSRLGMSPSLFFHRFCYV